MQKSEKGRFLRETFFCGVPPLSGKGYGPAAERPAECPAAAEKKRGYISRSNQNKKFRTNTATQTDRTGRART